MIFWVLLISIAFAAIIFPLWPMLAKSTSQEPERMAASALALRQRRDEIERERIAGRLNDQEAHDAQEELIEALAKDLDANPASHSTASNNKRLIVAFFLFTMMPVAAFVVYQQTGQPELGAFLAERNNSLDPEARAQALIADIEARTRSNPQDGEAWLMLAQARKFRGELPAALQAFQEVKRLLPRNARVLADHAETIALLNNRTFSGEPARLLRQALALDPSETKANALMGAVFMQSGQHDKALPHLRIMLASMPVNSEPAKKVAGLIAQIETANATVTAKARSNAGSNPVRPSSKTGNNDSATTVINGVINFVGEAPSDAVLFIVVRAASGPRIPVAVIRRTLPAFPFKFSIGSDHLMNPARTFADVPSLIVEARISLSGQAMRQSGDHIGRSSVISAGQSAGEIRIDQVVE